jgi:large subunit ribosomal protein L24
MFHEIDQDRIDRSRGMDITIVTTEAPIHVSNVLLVEGDGVTRIGFRRDEVTKRRPDGSTYTAQRSVRVSRKTGKEI